MRLRNLIHVGGPVGAGKTLFIERFLSSPAKRVVSLAVARCELDDTLTEPEEHRRRGDKELQRYTSAGAGGARRYRFPDGRRDSDAFYTSELMAEYSEAVLLEGDYPLDIKPDLAVFVSPPLAADVPLPRRVRIDQTREHQTELRELEGLLAHPAGVDTLLDSLAAELGGVSVPDSVRRETRACLKRVIDETRAKGPPSSVDRWTVADTCQGIEYAGLVVWNVRDDAERSRAEGLRSDLTRLRQDKEMFAEVAGPFGKRTPITIADLSDATDKDLKRALARVRRTVNESR